jgi:hypothetical protein
MRERPKPASQIPPEDYEFWHTTVEEQEGEGREVKFDDIAKNKGLWIVTMEGNPPAVDSKEATTTNPLYSTASKMKTTLPTYAFQPSQTTLPVKKKQPVKEPQRTDNFEAQRAKHVAVLGERMPVGRDGKRLPLPKPQPRRSKEAKSTDNMRHSGVLASGGASLLASSKNLK